MLRDSRVEANTVHLCTRITEANFNDFSMSYLDTHYSEWRCKDFLYFLFKVKISCYEDYWNCSDRRMGRSQ